MIAPVTKSEGAKLTEIVAAPIIIMGVSGAGKSTIGRLLAKRLPGGQFLDADDLHPLANVEKMRSGQALSDNDRGPWLDRVGRSLKRLQRDGPAVIACSALRRSYRRRLREWEPSLVFVCLDVPTSELRRRMIAREDHFMPASLLKSQLETLEALSAEERGVIVSTSGPPAEVILRIMMYLNQS